ncbi:hypothetical protein BGZ73_006183 [Actinomortierella ambigua]|nr:hypothetical protein BGZ73_006183 [Actinomortierella ambigua]
MLTYNQQQQQHHHLNMGQYGAQRMPPQVIKKMDGPQGQTQPHQGPGPADLLMHPGAGATPHTTSSGLVAPAPQHQPQHHMLQPLSFQPRPYGSLDTPSPPTPSPSPGNHPTVMIPPAKTHLDMSHNSPSTDPSSSPSSPTSNNAATTATTTKKRTRASPEQLAILEDTFLTNQSPNSKVREILAKKVKMSERSIQIWFQNRRAKVKQAQKRLELGHQEAMKAQYLNNGALLGMPQPLYGYPAPGGAPPGAKGLPMAPHLHPAGLARAPLSRSNSYDAVRAGAAPGARFGPHAGLGINMPGAANPALWAGQNPYGVPQSFGMRPTLQQQALLGARGVKRSFDAANEPLMAGAIPKPLHFPVAEGLAGTTDAATAAAAAAAAAAGGVANPNAVFAATAGVGVPATTQLPTLPTFDCDNLSIGTWRRMSTSNTDLSCFYCPTTRVMTWQIGDNGAHFKLTFSLTSLTRIEFYEVDPLYAQVDFDLSEVPQFFMETVAEDGTHEWKKCSDFTEAKQATLVLRHTIHGVSTTLKMQLMSLTIAYPPLQPLTTYREPQFPAQFHAYTTPIPQMAQFMDPTHYDHRRLLGSPMNGTFFGAAAAAAAAAAAGYDDGFDSDGSDLDGYGMVFHHHDGTQPPRPKSRRTASMPNPGMGGSSFLSVNMNTIPLHSSPLSMYSTTNANVDPTTAAISAAASSASLPDGTSGLISAAAANAGGATMAVTAAAGVATTTAIATSDDTLTTTAAISASSEAGSTADTKVIATTVPKVTVTASADSQGVDPATSTSVTTLNGSVAPTTTTLVSSSSEQQDESAGSGLGILSATTTDIKEEKTDEMGLTSQFNEFLAQAVVSTTPMAPLGFVGSAPMMHPGMMYATSAAGGHVDDGSVAYGLNSTGSYYSMMHEQASLAGVSLSDVESRLDGAEQTDGEESAF